MKVRYAASARLDIDEIHEFVSQKNPIAASNIVEAIREAADRLGEFPYIGHSGRLPGTYEWTVRACHTSSSTKCMRSAVK